MNGLEPRDLPEDRQKVIAETLCADAAARFCYDEKMIEHPTEPLLNKYYYKHSTGGEQSTTETSEWQIKEQNESALDKKGMSEAFEQAAFQCVFFRCTLSTI